jgi:hypothetical protein
MHDPNDLIDAFLGSTLKPEVLLDLILLGIKYCDENIAI